jgi:hypothetical protein
MMTAFLHGASTFSDSPTDTEHPTGNPLRVPGRWADCHRVNGTIVLIAYILRRREVDFRAPVQHAQ